MVNEQYCSECIYFENVTHEDFIAGDYRMWSEISCDMGNRMIETIFGYVPDDKPCEDFDEKNY